jgi:hypothetical protein
LMPTALGFRLRNLRTGHFPAGSLLSSLHMLHKFVVPHECNIEVVEHQCKMSHRCYEQEAVWNPNHFVEFVWHAIVFHENDEGGYK